MEGFKEGIKWLHSLADQGLIDPECYTHEWSQYVAKGKAHRYDVFFSWDPANIDKFEDFVPLSPLAVNGQRIITPQNGSFTSGYEAWFGQGGSKCNEKNNGGCAYIVRSEIKFAIWVENRDRLRADAVCLYSGYFHLSCQRSRGLPSINSMGSHT